MSRLMRAAVLPESGEELKLCEIPRPVPAAGEVLVRVSSCGVCHSDLHVIRGELGFPRPCVLGHEVTGTVEVLGSGIERLEEGDAVCCAFILPCGSCRHCVRGHDDLCESFFSRNRLLGVYHNGASRLAFPDGRPIWMYSMGGLAEYVVVPETAVFTIPDGVGTRGAAILGCSAMTSFGAVKNVAKVGVGESVAVIATGGVGLNVVRMASIFGADPILAVDVSDEKLALAREMGATEVVSAANGDPVEQIQAFTNGRGVDVAFEVLGNPLTVDTAIRSVDEGGRVVLVGIAPSGVKAEFDVTQMVRRKISISGSYGARVRTDMPQLLRLAAAGLLRSESLITEHFALESANEAYARLREGRITGRAVIDLSPVTK